MGSEMCIRDSFRDAGHRDWAESFARATSAALAKPSVTVDLSTMSLGY